MARKLASIVEIATCDPIPDTDKLSVATMVGKGWRVVTSRDEFKKGDWAVYFEIDSFLNPDDERYSFLKERCLRRFVSKSGQVLREGIRIKTIKLRGVVSQGLLMPIGNFSEITDLIVWNDTLQSDMIVLPDGNSDYAMGFDVTGILGVEHYDEVKEMLQPACGGNPICADAMSKFPSDYIPKSNEERIQNLGDWLNAYKDMDWEVTSKDDGSSVTMFYSKSVDSENPFGVCSRNLRLKPVDSKGNAPLPWKMAEKYDVERKLREYSERTGHEIAVQGELIGPGIQKDRDKYLEHEWHVFNIWDITEQKFILPEARRNICLDLGLQHVELVNPSLKVFTEYPTCDDILKYAEGKTVRGNEREGVVFKSNTDPSLSFKAVSNRYLMKQED